MLNYFCLLFFLSLFRDESHSLTNFHLLFMIVLLWKMFGILQTLMSVWPWTYPALATGSVSTRWAPTAVSVNQAGPAASVTWTYTSVPFSSPVNTTRPVLRWRAVTGVNAYLDSKENTVKEVIMLFVSYIQMNIGTIHIFKMELIFLLMCILSAWF